MSSKYALIIGNTEYNDPGLAQLTAPGKDAEDFARVLADKEICAFDEVNTLLNQPYPIIREAIDEFFYQKKPDDLMILYFSGHGVRDEVGELYLAVKNTNRYRLHSTAIKSDFIREAMDQSRSRRQVLILDCCNSGAFAQGTKAATGTSIGTATAFQSGYGHIILTASDSTQFAWEGEKVIGKTDNSLFTHFLVEGLKGKADRDGDGKITVDELYDYAYEQVKLSTPKQTPSKFSRKQQGEIFLRENMRFEDIKPIQLPNELIDEAEDLRPYVREAAVQKLERILKGNNIGLARSAIVALQKIIGDENTTKRVARVANQVLESYYQIERKTEEERRAKEKAEPIALLKAEEERLANEKAEAEQKAKHKAEGKAQAEQRVINESRQSTAQEKKEEHITKSKQEVVKLEKNHIDENLEGEQVNRKASNELPRAPKKLFGIQTRTITISLVSLTAFICACISFYAFAIYIPSQKTPTQTPIVKKTPTSINVKSTETIAAKLTNTAMAKSTDSAIVAMTAVAKESAADNQTRTAIAKSTNTARAGGIGPGDGSMRHADDGTYKTNNAGVDLRDFVVSATFLNPYSTALSSWDYGFTFRDEGSVKEYRLIIRSNKSWEVKNYTGDPTGSMVQKGELSNLNIGGDESNTVWLFCQNEIGILYINGDLVASFDLSDRINSGDVMIATGFYAGDELDGYSTDYKDFKVQAIQKNFGSTSGSLKHVNNNLIEHKSSGVELNNFVVTASFINPYSTTTGSWDYGFLFRQKDNNSQYRLIIRSNKEWELKNKINSGTASTNIQDGQLTNLNLNKGSSNTIWLFCYSDYGVLYVNGSFVAGLDLSARKNSGDVQIAIGFYSSGEVEGYTTDYTNFSIWEIP